VLDGKQHNTYDIEFYGPNPLSSVYYLAALRAVEKMAQIMDEPALAQRCADASQIGSQNLDHMLWNGEYYIQKLDDVNAYKYQHGQGCLSDQLLGQLHARILGLGDLLPAEHIRQAVKSIYDYNFRESFADHVNCQRTYALNDEAGLLLCSWPKGGRPEFPFVYSDEVWPGIEYQVAAHLIYEGWLDEGLAIVQAVRDRHDGYRRNPWNEVECGHHYARSMSSWAVLLALTGQQIDADSGQLSFSPVLAASTDDDVFRVFWSNGRAWGVFTQRKEGGAPEIEVWGDARQEYG
jgi:non-lysosomal glucosylceramidase